MTAMSSVSKNLYENREESTLPHTATTRTVGPDKHEHLQSVRKVMIYGIAIGKDIP